LRVADTALFLFLLLLLLFFFLLSLSSLCRAVSVAAERAAAEAAAAEAARVAAELVRSLSSSSSSSSLPCNFPAVDSSFLLFSLAPLYSFFGVPALGYQQERKRQEEWQATMRKKKVIDLSRAALLSCCLVSPWLCLFCIFMSHMGFLSPSLSQHSSLS
jgi:hypothetical protein